MITCMDYIVYLEYIYPNTFRGMLQLDIVYIKPWILSQYHVARNGKLGYT